jgi:hypothetical protein
MTILLNISFAVLVIAVFIMFIFDKEMKKSPIVGFGLFCVLEFSILLLWIKIHIGI